MSGTMITLRRIMRLWAAIAAHPITVRWWRNSAWIRRRLLRALQIRRKLIIMPYVPFHEKFPDIAKNETRSISTINTSDLPEDDYALIELYCDEPGCDCRRVFFNVFSRKQKKIVAVITYGWASKKYYAKWYGDNTPEVINELKGPALNATSPQSELAPALLQTVKHILNDQHYVARLKRHYKMFKQVVDDESDEKQPDNTSLQSKNIARNSPCPCGSGKKYKQCCGRPQ
ncbi:MAG: SEC-C domain-containing protein [Anaerolineae bacterium]|nr:SEC-C domain-containing protein [Anaerolineae bacterium]